MAEGNAWWQNPDLWAGIIGAGAGYLGGRQGQEAREDAGQYSGTTQNLPWGPSIPYREFGMERALDLLGKGGQRPPMPGGGGYRGPSDRTASFLDEFQNRVSEGHPLYGTGTDWIQSTLGGEDANPYRSQLFGELEGLQDPDLERFKSMLFAGQMPGGGSGVGDLAAQARGAFGGGGGGGVGGGPVGAADYIKEILGGRFLEGNPFLDETIDAATRGIQERFSERELPGILSQTGGQGRFGGGISADLLGQAERNLMNTLGDVESGIRFQDYEGRMGDLMQALGLGTSLDQTAMQAGAAAGASRFGSRMGLMSDLERLASQERLARMGALQGAIGQGMDLTQFGLSGQMGLADMFGQDQSLAMQMIPAISGLDIRDFQALAGPMMQQEQMTAQGQNQAANRRRQNFMWEQDRPWQEAMNYGNLINMFSGGYGTSSQQGQDFTGMAPYASSPWLQAAAGGLGAMQGGWGDIFAGLFGGGGGGTETPGDQGAQSF